MEIQLYKNCFLCVLTFILLTTPPRVSHSSNKDFNTTLKKLKLPFYSTLPILVKNITNKKNSYLQFIHIKAEYKNTQIQIDIHNKANSKQFKNLSFTHKILKSLYKPLVTPYRGEFSQTQKCKKAFLPMQKYYTMFNRINLVFIAGVSTRNIFGKCVNVKKYGAYSLMYFPKKQYIVQIRLFSLLKNYQLNLKTIFNSLNEK